MSGFILCFAGVVVVRAGFGQTSKQSAAPWPSLQQQFSQEYAGHKIKPGTALEKLIRDNQDFSLLRDDEKTDNRGFPPWLRVWWRKAHPELEYSANDPTGGYPLALHEILEWMLTHQDLKPGQGVAPNAGKQSAVEPEATIGPDLRISGISFLRFRNYYSLDNGATWTFDATASGPQTAVDKELMWVDHSASSPFQNQIYGIWHNGSPAYMNRRTAGAGGTWLALPIQV